MLHCPIGFARAFCATLHVPGRDPGSAVTIAPDLVAQILRLYTVEKWRVGTIARQLRVHRDGVPRVIGGNSATVHPSPLRPSRMDSYRPFMLETLTRFTTLTSSRLLQTLMERGYVGTA